MESATLERLMTSETVAGERSRCSASFLRLMGRREWAASLGGLGFDFFIVTGAVSHNEIAGASEVLPE
jgi:hypothetical protein